MRFGRAILGIGGVATAVAWATARSDARAATFATWRPFVLVAGLLLVGVVAHANGVFDTLGRALARAPLGDTGLVVAGLLLVAVVTALLNLDTAAAFLTPVLVLGVAHRKSRDPRLLYGALFMCNAASLLLPGSNLTNLIVLSSEHRSGSDFARAMWPAFVASVVLTALFVVCTRRRGREADTVPLSGRPSEDAAATGHPVTLHVQTRAQAQTRVGVVALVACAAAVVLMLAVDDPALAVLAVGLAAIGVEIARGRMHARQGVEVVDPTLLLGLFGVAVALGTLGRSWHWPSSVLASSNAATTAAIAAVASVLCNNLPSAALLAARPVAHARALLIGLNIGPNLAVTGSLSALLWYRTARTVGAHPRLVEVTRLGVFVVPLSIAGALVALRLTGAAPL